MKHELELKVQAWVDGQLPVHEADEVARLIETDAEARALLMELKHTRAALGGYEDGVTLPESREFYWSKVARDIERQQRRPQHNAESWLHNLRRMLIPVSAAVALLLVGLLATRPAAGDAPYELSDLVADSDTFMYTDEANGTTLIWFSYPTENELAEPDDSDIF